MKVIPDYSITKVCDETKISLTLPAVSLFIPHSPSYRVIQHGLGLEWFIEVGGLHKEPLGGWGDKKKVNGVNKCMAVSPPNILGGGVPHGSHNPDPISD